MFESKCCMLSLSQYTLHPAVKLFGSLVAMVVPIGPWRARSPYPGFMEVDPSKLAIEIRQKNDSQVFLHVTRCTLENHLSATVVLRRFPGKC